MSALSSDYTGCSVMLYDTLGKHLSNTKVISYNKNTLRIEVQETPSSLSIGLTCRLLILSSPAPCEYQGRVLKEGAKLIIALHHGLEKENRGTTRYKIHSPSLIEHLICAGRAYPLHTPLAVELINISKSGVRFRAPLNSLSDGDRFQMSIKINDNEKVLISEVTNHTDKEAGYAEYGCHFLIGSTKAGHV